jgi:hypothetical protein
MSDEHHVTCPYCNTVILSTTESSVLSHYDHQCVPILHHTEYLDKKTRLRFKWVPLHGWRLYRGRKVIDRATFEEVTEAVNSGIYFPVKEK